MKFFTCLLAAECYKVAPMALSSHNGHEGLPNTQSFDLFRITHSKRQVDLATATIRKFIKQGLPVYRRGKSCFVSRRELELFLRDPKANAQSDRAAERFSVKARRASLLAVAARRQKAALRK